jgi:hypothetical protein
MSSSGDNLQESSKNTQNALIEWIRNETTRCFTKIEVYVVSKVLSLVFKTVFGIFLAHIFCLKSLKQDSFETRLKTKKNTYTLVFVKYLVVTFRSHFECFWKIH